MPRHALPPKQEILPDPKYRDTQLAKFINHVMRCGKKSLAERIVYGALEILQTQSNDDALQIFKNALENVAPNVEVRSRRVGGATYQVPMEVSPQRRSALAMRWLVSMSRLRPEKTIQKRLAGEMMEASQGRGRAVKKREDVHRTAEANKAFAHYRR